MEWDAVFFFVRYTSTLNPTSQIHLKTEDRTGDTGPRIQTYSIQAPFTNEQTNKYALRVMYQR